MVPVAMVPKLDTLKLCLCLLQANIVDVVFEIQFQRTSLYFIFMGSILS